MAEAIQPPAYTPPPPGPYALPAPRVTARDVAITQLPCPGATVHPFQRLPRICPVVACPCSGESTASGPEAGTAAGGDSHAAQTDTLKPVWVKEFHQAAHFPVPRFDGFGQPVMGDGLVIYEGMHLAVYRDGTYDLSFTVTIPETTTTIRLQLVFTHPTSPGPYVLTLPPMRLDPKPDGRPGDPEANTFHVAHRGYSSLFRTDSARCPPGPVPGFNTGGCPASRAAVGCDWCLARRGTARFGAPLVVDDPSR